MQNLELEKRDQIYTVSRLNEEAKVILEDTFSLIWVEGEISNFKAPTSGHWYFCLKDSNAQVRSAMFRANQRKLNFIPKDGMHVLVKARVSLYENRGEFQLIAEDMEERGEGKLRRAFERLKEKLEKAGLFAASHKKTLPLFPKQVGVITSQTGAAIRDILTVLKRRYPCVKVIIYPTLVQGETAAPTLVNAIQTANTRMECDVLILARGGGSLEDLWPFNEETVAYAIYHSQIPIISGIGHEIDFTIADFVADKRASTPSVAAEMITPDQADLFLLLRRHHQQLLKYMRQKFGVLKQHLEFIQKHLFQQHPKRKLSEHMQRLDYCEATLMQHISRIMNKLQGKLSELDLKLHRKTPLHTLSHFKTNVALDKQQLINLMLIKLNQKKILLSNAALTLDALSPLSTLKRGFAIVSTKDKNILRDTTRVKMGDEIQVTVMNGSMDCVVKEITPSPDALHASTSPTRGEVKS